MPGQHAGAFLRSQPRHARRAGPPLPGRDAAADPWLPRADREHDVPRRGGPPWTPLTPRASTGPTCSGWLGDKVRRSMTRRPPGAARRARGPPARARAAPPSHPADTHVLYRETVRGVAFKHGLWASLAPKPIPDQAGNGTHLHASLTDLLPDGAPGGRNAFADPADRYGLSQVGYHFIGGLLAHLPALVALTCASVNSYRRLAPQMWASAYSCYGMDNREAAIRICSPLRGDPGSSVNLELKPSDSSANPYLALGAFIYAGLDGIRGKIDPGEAVNVDPATLTDSERSAGGTHRLPASLAAALDALSADEMMMDALGPLRAAAYLAVKRSEAAHFAHSTDPYYECFHHFTKL